MTSYMMRLFCIKYRASTNIILKEFHTTPAVLDEAWRRKKGWTTNPNTHGPLTDAPDYTFKDNRPTPLGLNQKLRMEAQKEYAAKIIELVGQVDYAVERHARLKEEARLREEEASANRLKKKGDEIFNP